MPVETSEVPVRAGTIHVSTVDHAIAALAAAQYGRVSRSQLRRIGLTTRGIEHRIERGLLIRERRGVYCVGHLLPTWEGIWMSAVLAVGADAHLGRRCAGALWGIRRWSGRVEVTSPRPCRIPGVTVSVRSLPTDEVTVHRDLPVTTAARTLFDLAAVLDPPSLRRAIEQAEVLRLCGPLSIADLIRRHPGQRGVVGLRAIIEDGVSSTTVTRSMLEQMFLEFVERSALSRPLTNMLIAGLEVDACWPDARLIVELDGRAFHHTATAFERDRARDRRLATEGWRVIRMTWQQLRGEERALARDLRALIGTSLSAGGSFEMRS